MAGTAGGNAGGGGSGGDTQMLAQLVRMELVRMEARLGDARW